jgi:biotin transport system substrate-specific component
VTAALLAALLAASAFVSIPIGAVPVTLQTFVVVLVALICSPAVAALALGGYLALGLVGVPVFSGGNGGVAALVGPTGGYLVGFAVGAWAGAAVRRLAACSFRHAPARDALAAATVLATVYALGAAWLALSMGMSARAAVAAGVAPFVLIDAVKATAALAVAAALRRVGLADTPAGISSM